MPHKVKHKGVAKTNPVGMFTVKLVICLVPKFESVKVCIGSSALSVGALAQAPRPLNERRKCG